MESENQITDADDAVAPKSEKPIRRVRLLPQLERDKDQENILKLFDDSFQMELGNSNAIVAKADENKQSAIEDNTLNSSTPRRKKDPLANLYSNLSPKYIGFVTPTTTLEKSSDDRSRATRRRQHKMENSLTTDDVDTQFSRDSSLDMTDAIAEQIASLDQSLTLGCVRRTTAGGGTDAKCSTPEHKNIRRKEFVSPIDKLLKKNGSIVDNHKIALKEGGEEQIEENNNEVLTKEELQSEHGLINASEENNSEIAVVAKQEVEAKVGQILIYHAEDKKFNPESNVKTQHEEDASIDDYFVNNADIPKKDMKNENDDEKSVNQNGAENVTESDEEPLLTKYKRLKLGGIHKNKTLKTRDPAQLAVAKNSSVFDLVNETGKDTIVSVAIETDKNKHQTNKEQRVAFQLQLIKGEELGAAPLQVSSKKNTKASELIFNYDEDSREENLLSINLPAENVQNISKGYNSNKDVFGETHKYALEAGQDHSSRFESNIVEHHNEFKPNLSVTHGNEEFTGDNVAAKSPSAVSMDSAKGSSIINEGAWMNYNVGDLFWGQIYNYCYWPCMVCPDPDGKTISTKEYSSIGDQHVMVHVRFFADNGRRNWVKRDNLMPFTTLDNYQDRLDDCRDKFGPKSGKFKLFVPKKTKVITWREAVSEMEIVAKAPPETRLEVFYEIFEKTKTLQKKERHRRKSMTMERNTMISDAESFYGSTENINNLTAPSVVNLKRERSSSPFSPAFSPVKSKTLKKRKVSDDNIENISTSAANNMMANDAENRRISQSSGISSTVTLDIFQGMEFESFHAVMKEFVLEKNQNEVLEKGLFVAVRNIWALKQVSREQLEHQRRTSLKQNEERDDIPAPAANVGGDVKRLSTRLKKLSARKSSGTTQLLSSYVDLTTEAGVVASTASKDMSTNVVEKSRRSNLIVNRPILEVIDDIFQLDNRYLFKGMSREPVCKYCFKPGGNMRRCSKNCSSWLHSECLHINFKENNKTKRRRLNGAKSMVDLSIETAQPITSSSIPDLTAVDMVMDKKSLAGLHVTSDTLITIDEDVICKECANKEPAKCMVCNLTDSGKEPNNPLVKCNMTQCDRAFHPACCKYWPQAKITISKNHIQSFRCPSHVCHTCVSDDPKGKFHHIANAKITKCVKCPATYHTDSTCIPAGSQILTSAHIICPRHASSKPDMTVNVNWCFICVGGGQVVCCETCPTAVHAQCLKIPIDPNEGYICEECESGRMPLYGEMVWAKFNNFRWWPAIILPPTEIPQNIARKTHNPSDFVVRFFGTHDHGWISRRRVYLYLEGDSTQPPKTKSNLDLNYVRGVKEAKEMYEVIKAKKLEQSSTNDNKEKLHPQPYVRIKANRVVPPVKLHIDIESVSKCECNPNDIDPCGADSSCLNRVLYHECNPKVCPAGVRCQNQMFESRISPRLDVVYTKERGFGLVNREPIAAGAFIIEYVGEIINDTEFRARMSQKSMDRDENFYFLSVEKDYIIDAGPKGNLARFMNHSCDPNCETQKWSVNSINRVGLFAIKNIPENSELTFNYHWDDLLGNEKKTCYCGSKNCAGQIGGKIKDDSKENFPIFEESSNSTKTKPKTKSKAKPLKRLPSTAATKRKRKTKASTVKHKSSKMTAAAALAATLSQNASILPDTHSSKIHAAVIDGSNVEPPEPASRSQSPEENLFC